MDIDETASKVYRYNFVHPDLTDVSILHAKTQDRTNILTGTAARIMNAPAPAMNRKKMNSPMLVLPARKAPDITQRIADCRLGC